MIAKNDIAYLFSGELRESEKKEIDIAVDRVIEEYGETLKLLAKD